MHSSVCFFFFKSSKISYHNDTKQAETAYLKTGIALFAFGIPGDRTLIISVQCRALFTSKMNYRNKITKKLTPNTASWLPPLCKFWPLHGAFLCSEFLDIYCRQLDPELVAASWSNRLGKSLQHEVNRALTKGSCAISKQWNNPRRPAGPLATVRDSRQLTAFCRDRG